MSKHSILGLSPSRKSTNFSNVEELWWSYKIGYSYHSSLCTYGCCEEIRVDITVVVRKFELTLILCTTETMLSVTPTLGYNFRLVRPYISVVIIRSNYTDLLHTRNDLLVLFS